MIKRSNNKIFEMTKQFSENNKIEQITKYSKKEQF